jgi:hypothetical protein
MLAFVLGHFVSHKCSVALAVVVSSFALLSWWKSRRAPPVNVDVAKGDLGRRSSQSLDFEINFQNPSAKFSNTGINLGILCGLA